MTRKWCILVTILAIAALGFVACDGKSPLSETTVTRDTGSSSFNTNTTTPNPPANNPPPPAPADPGRPYTIINGSEVNQRQTVDYCADNPGWAFPDGYDIRIRLDREDHEYRVVSNLFWDEAANCEAINEQPGRSSGYEPDGNFFDVFFRPTKQCGHYQWDVKLIDVTTGESWWIFAGVMNTGNVECSPPPCTENCDEQPTCEDVNAQLSCTSTVGEQSVDGSCDWSANADACQVLEDGIEQSNSCSGSQGFSYPRSESPDSHLWRLIAEKEGLQCDPTYPVDVPPLGECPPEGEPECPEQTWDTNSCSWVGECECIPEGEPECREQTWDTNTCSWVGECEEECVLDVDTGTSCLDSPVSGGGQVECDTFAPGSDFISKVESSSASAPSGATVAIVKSGASQCSPGDHEYTVFDGVEFGDTFKLPGQSHVTFCGCPDQSAFLLSTPSESQFVAYLAECSSATRLGRDISHIASSRSF